MRKKLKVVVIPAEGVPAQIYQAKDSGVINYVDSQHLYTGDKLTPMAMYWLDQEQSPKTNDVIGGFGEKGNGDWSYNSIHSTVGRMIGDVTRYDWKIVATNNPTCNLPNIPVEAIQKWIEDRYEYVEVEMEPTYRGERAKDVLSEKSYENMEKENAWLSYQLVIQDEYVVPVWDTDERIVKNIRSTVDKPTYEIVSGIEETLYTEEDMYMAYREGQNNGGGGGNPQQWLTEYKQQRLK